jgi:quinate dehydrogenase
MVIGAGGASRAAIYALLIHLGCSVVYLINRDTEKANRLVGDMAKSGFTQSQSVIVVESVEQSRTLQAPFYGVGWVQRCIVLCLVLNHLLSRCIPNTTPSTEGEKIARAIADNLFRPDSKGIFLDMYEIGLPMSLCGLNDYKGASSPV